MIYFYWYIASATFVLFSTGFYIINFDIPDEIDNVWDWLFYGLLWPVIALKYLIKWIIKVFTT